MLEAQPSREAYLRLGANPEVSYAALHVIDDGDGIPMEVQDKVFEPFFTTKVAGKGTGLGLSVCNDVLRQNGGVVDFISEEGKGSTFSVYLPLSAVRSSGSITEDLPSTGAPDETERLKVLVVDDEEAIRNLLIRILNQQGHQVQVVENGQYALESLENGFQPDLLLSDIRMPTMGGVKLKRRIREIYPDLPILLMSGYHDEVLQPPGEDPRRSAFLRKPFRPEELLLTIDELLQREASS